MVDVDILVGLVLNLNGENAPILQFEINVSDLSGTHSRLRQRMDRDFCSLPIKTPEERRQNCD